MKSEEFIINVIGTSNYEVAGKEYSGDIFGKILPTTYKMAYKVSIENIEKSYKKVVVIDVTNVFYSAYRIAGKVYNGDVLGEILPTNHKTVYKISIEEIEG